MSYVIVLILFLFAGGFWGLLLRAHACTQLLDQETCVFETSFAEFSTPIFILPLPLPTHTSFVNSYKKAGYGIYPGEMTGLFQVYIDEIRLSELNGDFEVSGGIHLRVGRVIVDKSGDFHITDYDSVNYLTIEDFVFYGGEALGVYDDYRGHGHFSIRDNGQDMDELIRHLRHKVGGRYYKFNYARESAYSYAVLLGRGELWTPIPESSTYGAALAATGLSVVIFRRRRGLSSPKRPV